VRFLADVNAGRAVVHWLKDQGHDVVAVADSDPRMRDDAILERATSERRVVVTTDRDFEEMIWRERKPHQGLLRLENLPRAERLALLADVLRLHGEDLATGAIVIATTRKIRVRRHP
jgi:predicted nuclease of predicted toxin-antitoxin system